jgi:hypothetical protein
MYSVSSKESHSVKSLEAGRVQSSALQTLVDPSLVQVYRESANMSVYGCQSPRQDIDQAVNIMLEQRYHDMFSVHASWPMASESVDVQAISKRRI